MNKIVAQMLGEADHHSPEERAQLDQHAQGGGAEAGGGAEEGKEVELAREILAAAKTQDYDAVIYFASELIRMHHPQAAASYSKQLSLMALPQSSSAPSSP